MKLPITLIVLTKNEEKNIEYCLRSAAPWVSQVVLVDSGSSDSTLDIAGKYGAEIFQHPFKNQADQFNWALDNLAINEDWILRLDADEVVSEKLWLEIAENLERASPEVSGYYLRRRVYFMGSWIRFGGYYPTLLLRLFRRGRARSEERIMDEHLVPLTGKVLELKNDFKDENRNGLSAWIFKHRLYAKREAEAIFFAKYMEKKSEVRPDAFGSQPERKRWLKEKLYLHLPVFLRPFIYFLYRYFLRFGFLDGARGTIFHFLQGCWYRFMVDLEYVSLFFSEEGRKIRSRGYVYPVFSTMGVFGFRSGGPGLGNLFFPFARALILAKRNNFRLINPSWATIKIGTFLRFERDKRLYLRIFNDFGISGLRKFLNLLFRRKISEKDVLESGGDFLKTQNKIVLVSGLGNFFKDIAAEREYIAGEFKKLLRYRDASEIRRRGPYGIGVHIRRGDFEAHQRVPLSWYISMIQKIRFIAGREVPVALASDGSDLELAEIMNLPGVKRLNMSAAADLFALSSSKIILASNSTFSAWAAFLGHIPIVWAKPSPELQGIFLDGTFDEVLEEGSEIPESLRQYIRRKFAGQ